MINFQVKKFGFALVAVCALGVFMPTDSRATLWTLACHAIREGCFDACDDNYCFNKCRSDYDACIHRQATAKQQTPPPPCRGFHCTLRHPRPPTTVGTPTRKPRPVR